MIDSASNRNCCWGCQEAASEDYSLSGCNAVQLGEQPEVSEQHHPHLEGKGISVNMPWTPIGLRDVEAPTFSRQLAHI
jgi:hypothetical protein